MYIIVGLGNPGKQYEHTRHNVGFEVIDRLAEKHDILMTERKHRAFCGKGLIGGQKAMLVKPQTFMNLSGESVKSAVDFYQIGTDELIVVYDDVSLSPGQLRIRVKVGVGEKPERMDLADYVLSHFSKSEWEMMEEAFKEAADAVEVMIADGADAAMNRFNAKKNEQSI